MRRGDVYIVLIDQGGIHPHSIEFDFRSTFVLLLIVIMYFWKEIREETLVRHMCRPNSGGRICTFTVYNVSPVETEVIPTSSKLTSSPWIHLSYAASIHFKSIILRSNRFWAANYGSVIYIKNLFVPGTWACWHSQQPCVSRRTSNRLWIQLPFVVHDSQAQSRDISNFVIWIKTNPFFMIDSCETQYNRCKWFRGSCEIQIDLVHSK